MLDDPFEGIPDAPPPPYRPLSPAHIEVVKGLVRQTMRPLERTLFEVQQLDEEERLGIAHWLGGMLHRPPLERPTPAYRPMRAFVEALWWDLANGTPDPLEPMAMHPRLDESHPWGEGPDA